MRRETLSSVLDDFFFRAAVFYRILKTVGDLGLSGFSVFDYALQEREGVPLGSRFELYTYGIEDTSLTETMFFWIGENKRYCASISDELGADVLEKIGRVCDRLSSLGSRRNLILAGMAMFTADFYRRGDGKEISDDELVNVLSNILVPEDEKRIRDVVRLLGEIGYR